MTPFVPVALRRERAFERLYREHADGVYRYSLSVLGNARDAEDATQTTFLNAYRAYRRGEEIREPATWLIAIARNVCRQRFRQESRRPEETLLPTDLAEARPEGAASAADVLAAVRQLGFRQRTAFVLHDLAGRSAAEIAPALGLSIGAVEMQVARARAAVRELLEEDLGCAQVEHAVSQQLAGTLSRRERASLRAHLRRCEDCASFARSRRAKRALNGLGFIPLPSSLTSLVAGGAPAGGLAVKAAVVVGGLAVAGGGYEVARHATSRPVTRAHRQAVVVHPAAPARAISARHTVVRPVQAAAHARPAALPRPAKRPKAVPPGLARRTATPSAGSHGGGLAIGHGRALGIAHGRGLGVGHGRGNPHR